MTPSEHSGRVDGRLRRMAKNTSVYALGELGLQLLSAFLVPILTLFLAPAELGVWSLAMMLLIGLSHICNPALHGAVTRFYFDHEHDEAVRRRFQGTILAFIIGWSLAVCSALMLSGPWLFDRLFDDLPFWPYGAFVVVMAFAGVLGVVPKAAWVAAEKSRPFVSVALAGSAVNLLGALGLVALAGMGVMGLFWGRTASVLLIAVPFVIYSARHIGLAWHLPDLREALRFSLPLVPHLVAHWILGMSDRFIIERFYGSDAPPADSLEFASTTAGLGLAAVGIYSAGYVFIDAVNMIAASMNRAWVPQFTRAFATPEEHPFVARSISWFFLAIGAMSGAMAIVAPTLVRVLFDDRYLYAADIAQVLALGGLFQGAYYIYVAGLFYHKDNRLVPVITVVSGLTNLLLNMLWIPEFGLHGAAWATFIGYLILAIGTRWGCRRLTRLPFERKRLLRMVCVLIPAVAAGLALDGVGTVYQELAAKVGVLIIAAAALWRLGAFSKERELG